MYAVQSNPSTHLTDVTLPTPMLGEHDLLIRIDAVAVNPVDYKRNQAGNHAGEILGYDAVGTVVATGTAVADVAIGERRFYAGDATRPGTFAEYHAVDARLTAVAPHNLSAAASAAMPLTGLTALEILHDKLGIDLVADAAAGQSVLVINGAGGVGSVFTQLAHWLGFTVIATASPANHAWLTAHGVTHPIDYHQPLVQAVHATGHDSVDAVVNLFDAGAYFDESVRLIRPFGHIVNINHANRELPLDRLQPKAASWDWELMFTKARFHFALASQGALLTQLARLLDNGVITSTLTTTITGGITAANLTQAYALLGANHNVGKIVITAK